MANSQAVDLNISMRLTKVLGHINDTPSWRYAGASSPRAEVVSFASRSVPRLRMALRRASARAAAAIEGLWMREG